METIEQSLDALDVPASAVDISYPILVETNYKMTLQNCRIEPNKVKQSDPSAAGAGDNLVIEHVLAQDGTTVKGEPVESGRITLTRYIGLTVLPPKEGKKKGRDMGSIKQDLTRVVRAAKLPADTKLSTIRDTPTILDGSTVMAKVGIRKAQGSYPESNDVNSYVIEG